MKITLSLIFVVCFVLVDGVFGTYALTPAVDEVEIPLDERDEHQLVPKCGKKQCGEIGKKCKCHNKCCSGYCGNDFTCACIDKFESCNTTQQCCVGTCQNFPNISSICYCKEILGSCPDGDSATCCQGYCDSQTKTCKCIDNNGKCTSDKDCCDGTCNNGICVCSAIDDGCSVDSDCCFGICEDNNCRNCVQLYQQPGSCTTDDDCCRGYCSTDVNMCQCSIDSQSCRYDKDCCGGTCYKGRCSCELEYRPCNPIVPDDCCFGTCDLNSDSNAYECRPSPLNSVCQFGYECASTVCLESRCWCYEAEETCTNGNNNMCCGSLGCIPDNNGGYVCSP